MSEITSYFPERRFGAVNWVGFWALYMKEVRRFLVVYSQTIIAPMVTTVLYLMVFLVAMNGSRGANVATFLAPGLIMMSITQNAFANTTSSIVMAKVMGNIVDILMAPLSPIELTLAISLAGATRGIVVGLAVGISMAFFVPLTVSSWGVVIFYAVASSLLLSTFGIIGGLWSDKFDHIAAVTNFIVTPLTFLSGTFYSIDRLSEPYRSLARFDPIFYVIDGFRAGFLGHSDAPLSTGIILLVVLNIALLLFCWRLFVIGYKIKS